MAAEAEEFVVEWPTMFITIDWTEHHCVVPDGDDADDPFILSDWQAWFYLNHYRVKPTAKATGRAEAFQNRRSQIVMPQKAGKGPLTASQVCLEAVGPALFNGFANGKSDMFRCTDIGCRCGWTYKYAKGEPMGRPWPTPLIQVTATSGDQTDNVYNALRPMIKNGPLSALIPKTGEEFIRVGRDGYIAAVTSNARSRLGQRVTFCPQDETGLWTPVTGMVKVAQTQRRGLAGMGGRAVETTNGWDPTEHSVAQLTAESKVDDIFRHHPLPPEHLDYSKREDREKIHLHVYAGCPWANLPSIEAEATELMETDPQQAERFFGNRIVEGGGKAFPAERWTKELAAPGYTPADKALIVIGVDGARFHDALALIATEVATGHQWPIDIIEKPDDAATGYEHDFDRADEAMKDAFDQFYVWRVYIDPQWIEKLVERWQQRWGTDRIIEWFTHRERQMAFAVRQYIEAQAAGEITHDGDQVFADHMGAAVKTMVRTRDDKGRHMSTLAKPEDNSKIDGAVAGVISWEARGDAIASDAQPEPETSRAAGWA